MIAALFLTGVGIIGFSIGFFAPYIYSWWQKRKEKKELVGGYKPCPCSICSKSKSAKPIRIAADIALDPPKMPAYKVDELYEEAMEEVEEMLRNR